MNAEPLRTEELVNYIRDFNRTSKCKLQLWRKTRVAPLLVNPPTVLRFGIPDVLIGYLSLVYTPTDSILVCESVTFFAPRERVELIGQLFFFLIDEKGTRNRPTRSQIMQRIRRCRSKWQAYFIHTHEYQCKV